MTGRVAFGLAALLATIICAGFTTREDPENPGTPVGWPGGEAHFLIHDQGSDDIDDGSDFEAIRAALAVWGAPTCTAFQFVEDGLTDTAGYATDEVSHISFIEAGWPEALAGSGAYTTIEFDYSQPVAVIVEVDIIVNGQEYSWSTDGTVDRVDIQSIMTHELGHAVGLWHSSVTDASMYFSTGRGVTNLRTLHEDDIAGVCFMYPAESLECVDDLDCPLFSGGPSSRTICETGVCVDGQASYGADCTEHTHCASGLCSSDPLESLGAYYGFCSLDCTTGDDVCPEDSLCYDDPDDPPARCYPGRSDCLHDDDCPGETHQCERDLDGRYRCLWHCLDDSHCHLLEDAVCHGGQGEPPSGICRVPGPLEEGALCDHGLECQSLACTTGGAIPRCADGTPGFPAPDGGSADIGAGDATGLDAEGEAGSAGLDGGPDDAPPEDATLEDAPLEDTPSEDATPEDATPEDATPEDATPEDATPEDAILADATPEGGTIEDSTIGEDTAPPDAGPIDGAGAADQDPSDVEPVDRAPGDGSATDDSPAGDGAPQDTPPTDHHGQTDKPPAPEIEVSHGCACSDTRASIGLWAAVVLLLMDRSRRARRRKARGGP